MNIYFVYRSPYGNQNGKYLKVFEAPSILAWFQHNWDKISNPDFLGQEVYGLNDWKRLESYPNSYEELFEEIDEKCYNNRTELIQVQTDDDEIHLVWYVFDEVFRNENKKQLTAYLIYEPYQLPLTFAQYPVFYTDLPVTVYPFSGNNLGNTYLITNGLPHDFYNENEFDLLYPPLKIAGISVSDLFNFLLSHEVDKDFVDLIDLKHLLTIYPKEYFWHFLTHFEELALKYGEDLSDSHTVDYIVDNVINGDFEKWRESLLGNRHQYRNELKKDIPKLISKFSVSPYLVVSEHLIQVSIPDGDCFYYWLIFDDYWASANLDLAESILSYRYKWNCLTP